MYPRRNYEMTKENLAKLLSACKPTPVMMIGGTTGRSPQENANSAWKVLGIKMGFDPMTVQPIRGKGMEFFTAVPSETKESKEARLKKESEEKRQTELAEINEKLKDLEYRKQELITDGQTDS